VLALFWGLASSIAHLFWSHRGDRILALAAALSAAEFARGHLFTGFPFDLLGYALTANDQMMQAASLVGVYGLTLVAALVAMTPALIWPADKRAMTVRLVPFFAALAIIAAQIGYGQYRLQATVLVPRTDMRLRLVQPDIDQAIKWQADSANFVLERLISLSEAKTGPADKGLAGVNFVVWPETALPVYPSDHPETLARIARMLPVNAMLLTGMPWRDPEDQAGHTAYNAILAIDPNGEIAASYYKSHLVPFGEYLPFADFFARFGITQFVPGNDGWTAGGPRRLMTPPGGPAMLPLICYEAVFSGDLGTPVADAALLLNLTNDAWFDHSIGPAQHFHHARLRAVEEGKPMVRVANTGVTALIDPLGRVTASLAPEGPGTLDVVPDAPLPSTVFARVRHWPLLMALAAIGIFELLALLVSRRHR
jgi:apolipoprotein N-acyltransferase